ncbi:hypothetical protein SAMN05216374_4215 [Tardiphaga sp. OK246]|jgi:hypothetical protein|uniref:hypothetical protein n=1 Tax=Tardiphaga sp. OK246 TaxID=1855307 RepID=UPI000B656C12|nr:hypothetical protein [Tardiphaga sp. OK246]SNT49602.1 hypothetical protein SAMN05216374_4215 [Tardiphaga sp. OK246]
MKVLVGCLASAGLLLASGAAQAQALPPMRGDVAVVAQVSDVGGPYAAMPPVEYAEPRPYGVLRRGYDLAVLPLREVYSILREAGFSALGMPQQRGLIYTVSAIDLDGEDGRLVIDARSGRILRFIPAYRMGDRMSEEIDTRYGPQGAVPTLPQYRRPPFTAGTATPAPKVASRATTVPLPKRPPARAVAAPAKPVTPAETKPVAVKPPETPPAAAPVQQSAVTEQKPAETKPPETTGAAPATPAAPEKKDAVAPTIAAPATEAKPATPPAAETPPPAQGLE